MACKRLDIAAGFLICLAALAAADEAAAPESKALREVLEADKTPALVVKIAAEDPDAATIAATLAKDCKTAANLSEPFADTADKLVLRDGQAAALFTKWLIDVIDTTRKAHPKEAAPHRGLAKTWRLHARVLTMLEKPAPAAAWIRAADHFMEHAKRIQLDAAREDDALEAITLLREGAKKIKGPKRKLVDHTIKICDRALDAHPKSTRVRRAVAAGLRITALENVKSKRVAQRALGGYFKAFDAIAREGKRKADVLELNETVTFARANDIGVKADYVSTKGTGAGGLIRFFMPATGRWKAQGGEIVESEKAAGSHYRNRSVEFSTYRWNSIYGYKDEIDEAGGDNVKGIAAVHYHMMKREHFKRRRFKKVQKPMRKRFNKLLPSGIVYVLEGRTQGNRAKGDFGKDVRVTSFFVKAVKAETTVRITIYEDSGPKDKDPELQDLLDSLEITKKKR